MCYYPLSRGGLLSTYNIVMTLRISRIIGLFLALFIPSQVLAYTDVSESTDYKDAIEFLTEMGVVEGYDDYSFKPEKEINRAEFLKMVLESGEIALNSGDDSCFPDVLAGEWFTPYVCQARDMGIVQGYPDGYFRPENTINLVEALKITLTSFEFELEESDPWYGSALEIAERDDLIPETVGELADLLNRGEMAELLYRVISGGASVEMAEEEESIEEAVFRLINEYRVENGLSELESNSAMALAARTHSEWMQNTETFSHTGEDGSSYDDRCLTAGTVCYGEIIATSSNPGAEIFVDLWKNSPPHDALMLTADFTMVGVGISQGYATVDFGY